MKKITSAALLALKLTWVAALAFTLTGAAVQVFYVFRELMPGGVPLQTTFGFEQLLQSAAERVGKFWMVLLLYMLGMDVGKSVKTIYTMNRLGLSENQMTLVFGAVFTGYFLLYWALQIAVCYGFFVWYSRFTLVGSNAWMLACWRSEWLHTLLLLGEWWGYLRNTVICLSFGCSAAFASQQGHRGKVPLTWFIAPLLCVFLLSGRIGSIGMDMSEHFGMELGVQRYYNPLRGGWETVPIAAPYFRFNNGAKFGFDVGGLLYEIFRDTSFKKEMKKGHYSNPTITPPGPKIEIR